MIICTGGLSASVAQHDVHQKARNQASSVESNIVLRRVDGLTIPWQRQAPNNRYCRQSPSNWVYVGLANVRCENWAYGSTSKPTRSILSLPAMRPEPSWTPSLKPQTCINICRFSGKCCRTRSFPRCTTCYVTSYALESMRKGVALCNQIGYMDKRDPPISAQEVYQNFTRSSLSSMHSIHAGCSKGACAVYNLGKHCVTPSLWRHTLASSTHNCGIRKRELGAGSPTKGIWTLYGCLGKRRLESWPRQRQTATAPKGCCPGPYVTVAPASNTSVQLWLCAAHLVHQADTAKTCHMGRTALCPHQLIASRWWASGWEQHPMTMPSRLACLPVLRALEASLSEGLHNAKQYVAPHPMGC